MNLSGSGAVVIATEPVLTVVRCEICRRRQRDKYVEVPGGGQYRRCDRCRQPIPHYPGMQGAGFESASVDHTHPQTVQFGRGVEKVMEIPISLELCHACYLADYAAVYPDEPAPWIANVESRWAVPPQRQSAGTSGARPGAPGGRSC